MRAKPEPQGGGATSPRAMGTRFRPSDPDAVRRRFAAIRTRAFERVAEERRAILARLARERSTEKRLRDEAAIERHG